MRTLTTLALLSFCLVACDKPAEPPTAPAPLPVTATAELEELTGNAAIAEQAIPQFHMALNDARFEDILKSASQELKNRKTQAELLETLKTVHSQLGAITGAKRQSWKSEEQLGSTLVSLIFTSAYTANEATEKFVFRVEDQVARLVDYSIESKALTLK